MAIQLLNTRRVIEKAKVDVLIQEEVMKLSKNSFEEIVNRSSDKVVKPHIFVHGVCEGCLLTPKEVGSTLCKGR